MFLWKNILTCWKNISQKGYVATIIQILNFAAIDKCAFAIFTLFCIGCWQIGRCQKVETGKMWGLTSLCGFFTVEHLWWKTWSPVISATSHLGDSQVGDKPTRRQPTRVATRVGQLGDNLFRLSVCFALIEQNKLSKKAVLSQGKPCNAAVNVRRGAWLKAYSINSLQFLLLLLRLQQVLTVGVFLFLTHRLECNLGRLCL